LQVLRANASEEAPYLNPCSPSYQPKASTKKACNAAGLKYTGNKFAHSKEASHCCVSEHWVCNMGDEKHCTKPGPHPPTYLGDTKHWVWEANQGNCCLPPIPAFAKAQTWSFDTREDPKKEGCKTKEVKGKHGSPTYTLHAFWTGKRCSTTAEVHGNFHTPTCKKTRGACDGVDIGEGMCCYHPKGLR